MWFLGGLVLGLIVGCYGGFVVACNTVGYWLRTSKPEIWAQLKRP